jgi:outer membrane lipoprotein-sorting protein
MNKLVRKIILSAALFIGISTITTAQVTTASTYFKTVSEYYASLRDYEVDFEILIGKKETYGTLSYLSPNYFRMDYTSPANQVICYNGEFLTMYLPETGAVLQQEPQGGTVQSPMGLSLMSRYYNVAYEVGQDAVPLDESSSEMVVKFILNRKSSSEAFRYIKIAVNPNTKLIRRIEAVTPAGVSFVFNFSNYRLNQGIAPQRFIYDPPSSANNLNNFLTE